MASKTTKKLTANGWIRAIMDINSPYPAGMMPQAWEATKQGLTPQIMLPVELCGTYWGTHGCHKPKGHKGSKHVCRDEDTSKVCHAIYEIQHGRHKEGIHIAAGQRFGVDKRGYLWSIYE